VAFDLHVGINYSGAGTPTSRSAPLQVYAVAGGRGPEPVRTPVAPEGQHWNWTRRETADWLIDLARSDQSFIAGIDHAFGFPIAYFERYGLKGWDQFLDDFRTHWPTDAPHNYVDFVRDTNPPRTGSGDEFRLVEMRTRSAKSVFRFEGHGCVAKSTHAGLPWLRKIRREIGDRVHFWPFDGWELPEDRSLIAEVRPSNFRDPYPRDDRTTQQHDAYTIARWLFESDRKGLLNEYARPTLTDEERRVADLEGWILGVA
jgi:hypothetical protein